MSVSASEAPAAREVARSGASEVFVGVSVVDPRARPLFEELAYEYGSRYAGLVDPEALREEFVRYPPEHFEPPLGALVLLLREGIAIAGGAFMPHADAGTTEFKRIWVARAHRGQGLSRRVLVELERRALGLGYTRVYLSTGPRQPEAIGLYRSSGYRLFYAHDFDEDVEPGYRFDKWLAGGGDAALAEATAG
ncbi:GNAT family N-acetyltransferase [Burkholderia gladioli]|uniref:GNAT family N-acetyltransferase n=1 Tax=Burkholderia gladioli TaxID=28095 RepID=UPI00164225E4|nr:GNAT family N-acetyltransferase [Burkholderia gladioli]